MAVELEIPSNTFIASNDIEFLIDFYIEGKDNIEITLDGQEVPNYLYTVSKYPSSNGARITFNTRITGEVVIKRISSLSRSIHYSNTLNNITPNVLNEDFDRVYRILQEKDLLLNEVLDNIPSSTNNARFDVRDFKTDLNTWTEAIQLAIDTVHALGGGVIFIPTGTYMITQLVMKSYVSLVGEGSDLTVLKSIAGTNLDMLVGEDIESVSLYRLRLNGNYLSDDWNKPGTTIINTSGGGINWSCNAFILEDVTVFNVAGIGMLSRPRSIPQTKSTLQVTSIAGIIGVCGKEGLIIRGGYGAGNGDWLIKELFVGLCGLEANSPMNTIVMSDYYPGEPCDGVVFHRTNIEVGLIHTYANWSGCGFRTRDICRLTSGGVIISESNRSQVRIDEGAYGSAKFDVRYLGTLHPAWTAPIPTYVQGDPNFTGVTIEASKRFSCEVTVRRIQQPSPRVVGVTAVHVAGSSSVRVLCSSTVAGQALDPEYGEFLSGDAVLYTGDAATIHADITECNGHALNIQGSTGNITFSVAFNKEGGAALYRDSLANTRFGNIITGTIHRSKLGFKSVGTPAIEQINLSMISVGNDEVVFEGNPPSFTRDSLWRINAAISEDGLQTLSTQKSFSFDLNGATTTTQSIAVPHGYLYKPDIRQVIFSLEESINSGAVLEYLVLSSITDSSLVFTYKFKSIDSINPTVNVFISQNGGGVGGNVLANSNNVDSQGNLIDYLNILNMALN